MAVDTRVFKAGTKKGAVKGPGTVTWVPFPMGLGRWIQSSSKRHSLPLGISSPNSPFTNLLVWRHLLWEDLGFSAWSLSLGGSQPPLVCGASTIKSTSKLQLSLQDKSSTLKILVEKPTVCYFLYPWWPMLSPYVPSMIPLPHPSLVIFTKHPTHMA